MCININVQHETRPNKTSRRTAEAFEHSGWWCVKWHEIIGGGGRHPCVPTINPATPCTDGIGRAPMLLKIDNPKKTVAPAGPPYEAKISWSVLGKIRTARYTPYEYGRFRKYLCIHIPSTFWSRRRLTERFSSLPPGEPTGRITTTTTMVDSSTQTPFETPFSNLTAGGG